MCTAAKKPFVTPEMKKKRLRWARKFAGWTKKEWSSIWFVDESNFQTQAASCGKKVRRREGEDFRFDPKFTRKEYKTPAKLSMWGAISGNGVKKCRFLKQGETMKSANFVSMLKKEVCNKKPSTKPTILLDNASIHRSRETKTFLKQAGIKTIFLPPCSPDIMPIENAYGLCKNKLNNKNINSLKRLRTEAGKFWRNLSPRYLKNLSSSMPNRIREVIKRKGEMICY